MPKYLQELAQDAVCQSHTGHMTGLWFLPARPLRLNTNERINKKVNFILEQAIQVKRGRMYIAVPLFSLRAR